MASGETLNFRWERNRTTMRIVILHDYGSAKDPYFPVYATNYEVILRPGRLIFKVPVAASNANLLRRWCVPT